MGDKKRLVTRSDFDGLVCAMLLKEIDLIDEAGAYRKLHPVNGGKLTLSAKDDTFSVQMIEDCP